jgi:hypothetical protein
MQTRESTKEELRPGCAVAFRIFGICHLADVRAGIGIMDKVLYESSQYFVKGMLFQFIGMCWVVLCSGRMNMIRQCH